MASSKVSPKDLASPVVEALNTIDSVADQITVIDSNTDSIKVTVEDTNAKLDGIDVDIDTVVSQSTVIDENVDNVKITVEDNNSKINEIDTEIDDLNEDIDLLKSTIITLNQELATVKSLATEIEKNVIDSAGSNIDIITADATATEEQILYGEVAYVKGERIIGTMPNNGAVNKTLNAGESFAVPEGYHDGTGVIHTTSLADQTDGTATAGQILLGETAYVDGVRVTGEMPNIGTVNQTLAANGTFNIPKGYHDGTGKVTQQLTNQAATTYNPDTKEQTIKAGTYLTGDIKIAATTGTATADKVLDGETFNSDAGIGVTGTMPNNGSKSANLNCGQSFDIAKGYHDGTGKVVANSLLSQTPGNATSGDMLAGKTAWVEGTEVTGTIESQGAQTITPGTEPQTIQAGKFLTGNQTILGDPNLTGENIRKGKSIYGVSGTFDVNKVSLIKNGTLNLGKWTSGYTNPVSLPRTAILKTATYTDREYGYIYLPNRYKDGDLGSDGLGYYANFRKDGITDTHYLIYDEDPQDTSAGTITYQYYDTDQLIHTSVEIPPSGEIILDISKVEIESALCLIEDTIQGYIWGDSTDYVFAATTGTYGRHGLKLSKVDGSEWTLKNSSSTETFTLYYSYWGDVVDDGTGEEAVDPLAGTATTNTVLDGYTFSSTYGVNIEGTMPNNGSIKQTLSAGGEYTIPEGYHDGTGSVTAKDLASQTDGTATAGQILAGETAYVDGVKVIGEMPNNGQLNATLAAGKGKSISPGYYSGGMITAKDLASQTDGTATAGQILAGETAWVDGVQVTGEMPNRGSMSVGGLAAGASYSIPAGYHDGTGRITAKSLESQTDGTATAGQILIGETAWVDGVQVTGEMPNVGALNPPALSAGGEYPIPAGYHNGSGKIKALSLVAQTSGTAMDVHILSGKTAWVNGSEVTGTMHHRDNDAITKVNNSAVVVPGDLVLLEGYDDGKKYVGIRSGKTGYMTANTVVAVPESTFASDINLQSQASKIVRGETLFGVAGTADTLLSIIGSSTRVRTGDFGAASSTVNENGLTVYRCHFIPETDDATSVIAYYDLTENVFVVPGKFVMYHTQGSAARSTDGTWVTVPMGALSEYDISRDGDDFVVIDTPERYYAIGMASFGEDYFYVSTSKGYTSDYVYWYSY